jgi:protein phosphatase
VATIQWYATSTYFVGFDGDEVAIYRGRPGGILWVDPELVEATGIDRSDVPARYLPALEDGNEQPSRSEAEQVVANIERDIDEATPAPAVTTTTVQAR